jgi:hypothetical protein
LKAISLRRFGEAKARHVLGTSDKSASRSSPNARRHRQASACHQPHGGTRRTRIGDRDIPNALSDWLKIGCEQICLNGGATWCACFPALLREEDFKRFYVVTADSSWCVDSIHSDIFLSEFSM